MSYFSVNWISPTAINISLLRLVNLLFVAVAKFVHLNFKGFVCMVCSTAENDKNSEILCK